MRVYVEGFSSSYEEMFSNRGHEVVDDIAKADVVQFIGGSDVTPGLYCEDVHPATHFNNIADERSKNLYKNAIMHGLPCTGICRGGQFLNVVNGGKMYQDVNGHALYGTHAMFEDWTKREIQVTSTHHQMMRPSKSGEVVCWADEATIKEHMSPDGDIVRYTGSDRDVEVVFYPLTRNLCFQPHPEMVDKDHECQEYYFELLERLLGLK